MSLTRASQTPLRTGDYLTVSVAVADLQAGNVTIASSGARTDLTYVADCEDSKTNGTGRCRILNSTHARRDTFRPVWVRSLTPTQRQAWVDPQWNVQDARATMRVTGV